MSSDNQYHGVPIIGVDEYFEIVLEEELEKYQYLNETQPKESN